MPSRLKSLNLPLSGTHAVGYQSPLCNFALFLSPFFINCNRQCLQISFINQRISKLVAFRCLQIEVLRVVSRLMLWQDTDVSEDHASTAVKTSDLALASHLLVWSKCVSISACLHLPFSESRLLSKNIKIKVQKILIYLLFCMIMKRSLTVKKEHTLRVFSEQDTEENIRT